MGCVDVRENPQEAVEVRYQPAANLAGLVAQLDRPWIADEGPMSVGLRQAEPAGEVTLRPRGLAFDQQTTLFWNEDEVQVASQAEAREGVLAVGVPVLVNKPRFETGPEKLRRVDYFEEGCHLASRYFIQES